MPAIAAFLGRLLLALLFVMSGIHKVMDPASAGQLLAGKSLPATLAMPLGIAEIVGGFLLGLGIMSRLVSLVLAIGMVLTVFFFHNQFADPVQGVEALQKLAIAGGLLVVFAYGQMRWSYDHMRAARRGEVAAHDADVRAHDAELRAARAEGAAQAAGVPVTGTGTRPKRRWF